MSASRLAGTSRSWIRKVTADNDFLQNLSYNPTPTQVQPGQAGAVSDRRGHCLLMLTGRNEANGLGPRPVVGP